MSQHNKSSNKKRKLDTSTTSKTPKQSARKCPFASAEEMAYDPETRVVLHPKFEEHEGSRWKSKKRPPSMVAFQTNLYAIVFSTWKHVPMNNSNLRQLYAKLWCESRKILKATAEIIDDNFSAYDDANLKKDLDHAFVFRRNEECKHEPFTNCVRSGQCHLSTLYTQTTIRLLNEALDHVLYPALMDIVVGYIQHTPHCNYGNQGKKQLVRAPHRKREILDCSCVECWFYNN